LPKKRNNQVLTRAQKTVIEELLAGETAQEAAKKARVKVSDVRRWQQEDHEFQAAYNRSRQELLDAINARLLWAAHEAAGVVAGAIERGDVRAAVAILKGMGAVNGSRPSVGPQDAETLRLSHEARTREAGVAAREHEAELVRREMFVGF
jgi:hypothetical protein